jgi:argininosuccinate lyase
MIGGQLNPPPAPKEGGITVNPQPWKQAAKKGYATATDLADYLVKKGLPFRDAHETVAHAVKAAQSHNVRPVRAAAGRAARSSTPPSRKTCSSRSACAAA